MEDLIFLHTRSMPIHCGGIMETARRDCGDLGRYPPACLGTKNRPRGRAANLSGGCPPEINRVDLRGFDSLSAKAGPPPSRRCKPRAGRRTASGCQPTYCAGWPAHSASNRLRTPLNHALPSGCKIRLNTFLLPEGSRTNKGLFSWRQ